MNIFLEFYCLSTAPEGYGPFFAWITAYMNILGQITALASADFGLALFFEAFLVLVSDYKRTYNAELGSTNAVWFYAMFLFLHCFMNCLPTRFLSWINNVTAIMNISTLLVIIVVVMVMSPDKNSGSWVAQDFGWCILLLMISICLIYDF